MVFGFGRTPEMVSPTDALPGREQPLPGIPDTHEVLGTSMHGPWPEGTQVLYVAMGCFWGSERIFWKLPGVVTTAVGYMGGYTPNPTYEETCTGRTGHAEVVRIVALLSQPVMPESSNKILDLLVADVDRQFTAVASRLEPGTVLPKPTPVFPRYEN